MGGTATLSSVVGPGKYNGQAYATVTVGNGGDGIWQRGTLSLAGGQTLQVKGAFRANIPSGDYKLLLVTRPFDYGTPDSCSVNYATSRDWNEKTFHIDYPFQIRKIQTKGLTTSWNEVNTAHWAVPHITTFPGEPREDGLDCKLWVKKLSPGSMDVDFLCIRLVN